MSDPKQSLFEQLGGKETLQKVHKIFYDKIYAHAWMGQFFKHVEQKVQEDQATDFMMEAMGGPSLYCGKFPIPAHSHMYITEELFELRHELLKESLLEAQLPEELRARWLKIDFAFKTGIVKKTLEDCKPRYKGEDLLVFPDPRKKAA